MKLEQPPAPNNEQKFRLQNLATVLKSAYRGQDIEWWDEEDDVALQKDEGSGAEDFYDDSIYGSGDEEYEFEGSGDDDVIIVPTWTKEKSTTWNPWPKIKTTTDPPTTTQKPFTGGTSSVHFKPKLAVVRAVLTYMLPLTTCFLGSFLVDLPWGLQ